MLACAKTWSASSSRGTGTSRTPRRTSGSRLTAAWAHLKKERPPATHYLRELGGGLRMPAPLLRHLMYLTPDYTVARYPDAANGIPYELYDAELAREKVAAAREVIQWVARRLSGKGSSGKGTSRA
ncbi:MAG: HEPN domain-containing protein [Deltaproteobacteria bacterium]|nr:HEPN domain-containing protein [Deltaproteobacteria bacterium]